jgi:hypothetical protein
MNSRCWWRCISGRSLRVEHAERGEQGGGAVPLVAMRHSLAGRLDRTQPGLGACDRMDLVLLVERKNTACVGGSI